MVRTASLRNQLLEQRITEQELDAFVLVDICCKHEYTKRKTKSMSVRLIVLA